MGNVIDALRDMAEDDDQSNVEFAAAFQGKVRSKKGKKSRHPSREATSKSTEPVERVFIPQSVVPWTELYEESDKTTNPTLRSIMMKIRHAPRVKRGRGESVPVDVTDAEMVAFKGFVEKCVKTIGYSYMKQKAMQRFAGLI